MIPPVATFALDTIIHGRWMIHLMRTINSDDAGSAQPATDTHLVDSMVDQLHAMIGSLRCAGTGRMVKAGISMTHLHTLWVLEHHGDLPMSRLADLLDVSLSNATGLIDRMEERGLRTAVIDEIGIDHLHTHPQTA